MEKFSIFELINYIPKQKIFNPPPKKKVVVLPQLPEGGRGGVSNFVERTTVFCRRP